jgi:hypothetical protein
MNRITLALAAALSLVFTPLAAQETDCDGWVTSDAPVAVQFWEAATAETVSDCLNAGADANAGNESGDTPLLLAAAYNSDPDVLTVLLDAGADATAVDAGGQTPFEIVMRAGDQMGSEIFWRLFNASGLRDYSNYDLERTYFDPYDPLQDNFPALYDVTDVAGNDVLYVRNAPSADADIRSALLPTATDIEILYVTPDEAWGYATMLTSWAHNIPTDMDTGWVSMRYMARQSEQDEVWYPPLTKCGGDEPSWYIDFEGASWSFGQYGESAPYEMATFKAPFGRGTDEFTITSETMSAVISHTPTGWGETDMAAGLEIHLITHKPIVFRQGVVAAPYVVRGECTITPFE